MATRVYYDQATGGVIGTSADNVVIPLTPTQAYIDTSDATILTAISAGKPVFVVNGVLTDLAAKNAAVAIAAGAVAAAVTAETQQVAMVKQVLTERGYTPL